MLGIGVPELIVIFVIVLIVFGAGKLPEIGGAIGQSIKNFKKSIQDADENETAPESKKIDEKK